MIDLFLHWLENMPLSVSIAQSDWAFAVIETAHVIALALVIGTVCVVDLRILELASAKRPYRQVAQELLPWTWGAFCVSVVTGSLMFITQASAYFENAAFRIKFLLLLLAGINMLIFEFAIAHGVIGRDDSSSIPWLGKLAALLSLTLWISVVFFGRRVGFTMVPG